MALTVTKSGDWYKNIGSLSAARVTVDFDSSYPTGGESFTPADVGMRVFEFVSIESKGGLTYEFDYTNNKIKAYAQGVLVGSAGSQTLDDFPVTAGVGVTADTHLSLKSGSATIGLGALKEVPDTNDLSSITGVRVFCIGY